MINEFNENRVLDANTDTQHEATVETITRTREQKIEELFEMAKPVVEQKTNPDLSPETVGKINYISKILSTINPALYN